MADKLNNREPHAYIHIPPETQGGQFQRLTVPIRTIRKFDYKKYLEDPKYYEDQQLKYRDDEGNKKNCFVLYAADSLVLVQIKVNSHKRFRVPSSKKIINVTDNTLEDPQSVINEDANEDETVDNEEYAADEKRAKLARKALKKSKKQSEQESSTQILSKYIQTFGTTDNADESLSYENHDSDPDLPNGLLSSTFLKDVTNRGNKQVEPATVNKNKENRNNDENPHSKCAAAMNAYKQQVIFFQNMCKDAETEIQNWKEKYDKLVKEKSSMPGLSDSSLMTYYDQLYRYDGPFEMTDESETVTLLNGVECKKIAYKDAFKSSKPIKVIKKLMFGIYGYEDLITRNQRSDKRSEELQPLCKKKNEAIERELYRFLRLNNYNVQLIKLELQEIDKYYHNAISCAKLKYKRQKLAEEALKQLQEQNAELASVLGENI